MFSVWLYILLDRESSCSCILRKRSRQFHNDPVLVPTCKLSDTVMDPYCGHNCGMKTRVVIRKRMDVVKAKYGLFPCKFHLMMWLFQFITVIILMWDYVMWCMVALLVCIGH